MKYHLINAFFEHSSGNRSFTGLITGTIKNGKLVISPSKLYKQAFNCNMPEGTKLTIL